MERNELQELRTGGGRDGLEPPASEGGRRLPWLTPEIRLASAMSPRRHAGVGASRTGSPELATAVGLDKLDRRMVLDRRTGARPPDGGRGAGRGLAAGAEEVLECQLLKAHEAEALAAEVGGGVEVLPGAAVAEQVVVRLAVAERGL